MYAGDGLLFRELRLDRGACARQHRPDWYVMCLCVCVCVCVLYHTCIYYVCVISYMHIQCICILHILCICMCVLYHTCIYYVYAYCIYTVHAYMYTYTGCVHSSSKRRCARHHVDEHKTIVLIFTCKFDFQLAVSLVSFSFTTTIHTHMYMCTSSLVVIQ